MTSVSLEELQEGDLVKFTYLQESGNYRWYRWVCTATYVAHDDFSYRGGRVILSFRPVSGTSEIPRAHIEKMELVSRLRDRSRSTREADPGVRLPARAPGAVPAPETAV